MRLLLLALLLAGCGETIATYPGEPQPCPPDSGRVACQPKPDAGAADAGGEFDTP